VAGEKADDCEAHDPSRSRVANPAVVRPKRLRLPWEIWGDLTWRRGWPWRVVNLTHRRTAILAANLRATPPLPAIQKSRAHEWDLRRSAEPGPPNREWVLRFASTAVGYTPAKLGRGGNGAILRDSRADQRPAREAGDFEYSSIVEPLGGCHSRSRALRWTSTARLPPPHSLRTGRPSPL
jgi:hypothetical protein